VVYLFIFVVGHCHISVPDLTGSHRATRSMHAIHSGFHETKRVVRWVS